MVISSRCADQHAAAEVLALLATDEWRGKVTQGNRVLSPRATPEQAVLGPNPMLRASAAAATAKSHAFPVAPGWSERPLVDFARAVLTGADIGAAAVTANQTVAAEFGRAPA
jgi:hypothetical protein